MFDFGPWHEYNLRWKEDIEDIAKIGTPEMQELAKQLLENPTQETRARLFDLLLAEDKLVHKSRQHVLYSLNKVKNPYR